MRHIVYLLLVANGVYLGWNLFQSQSDEIDLMSLPPLPDGARSLVTLQEHVESPSSQMDAAGLDTLTAMQPPSAMSEPGCQALGPFSLHADVEAITHQLNESGLDPVQRTIESRVEKGYWVYLPAMERVESREIVKQMEARGDDDYYVGQDWFISLGTFKEISRAELRLAEVQKYGLDAVLEPRYDTQEMYWLELPHNDGDAGLAAVRAEYPGLELHTLSCQ